MNSAVAVKPKSDKQIPDELKVKLESFRCVQCGRFLGYYAIVEGTVAIKCHKCDTWNVVNVESKEIGTPKGEVLTPIS